MCVCRGLSTPESSNGELHEKLFSKFRNYCNFRCLNFKEERSVEDSFLNESRESLSTMKLRSISEYDYKKILDSSRKSRSSYYMDRNSQGPKEEEEIMKKSTQMCTQSPDSDKNQNFDNSMNKEEESNIRRNNFLSVPMDHTFSKELSSKNLIRKEVKSIEPNLTETPISKGLFGYAYKSELKNLYDIEQKKSKLNELNPASILRKASENLARQKSAISKTRKSSKNTSKGSFNQHGNQTHSFLRKSGSSFEKVDLNTNNFEKIVKSTLKKFMQEGKLIKVTNNVKDIAKNMNRESVKKNQYYENLKNLSKVNNTAANFAKKANPTLSGVEKNSYQKQTAKVLELLKKSFKAGDGLASRNSSKEKNKSISSLKSIKSGRNSKHVDSKAKLNRFGLIEKSEVRKFHEKYKINPKPTNFASEGYKRPKSQSKSTKKGITSSISSKKDNNLFTGGLTARSGNINTQKCNPTNSNIFYTKLSPKKLSEEIQNSSDSLSDANNRQFRDLLSRMYKEGEKSIHSRKKSEKITPQPSVFDDSNNKLKQATHKKSSSIPSKTKLQIEPRKMSNPKKTNTKSINMERI